MSAHRFCRDFCLASGEPMGGSGQLAERFLLLRWPRGKWRSPKQDSIDLGTRLSGAIATAIKAGIHVALCDRTNDSGSLPDLADPQAGRFIWRAQPDDLADHIDNFRLGLSLPGQEDARASILVCTDSRRDPCCAKHGFGTYKALLPLIDPHRFNLVQTTHLGGCRYAASVIVLPARQRYGRLDAQSAPHFLAALEKGEIYLPLYRGRPDLSPAEQVAEMALLDFARTHRVSANIALIGSPEPAAGQRDTMQMSGRVGDSEISMILAASVYHVYGRCSAIGAKPPEASRRWKVVSMTATPPL